MIKGRFSARIPRLAIGLSIKIDASRYIAVLCRSGRDGSTERSPGAVFRCCPSTGRRARTRSSSTSWGNQHGCPRHSSPKGNALGRRPPRLGDARRDRSAPGPVTNALTGVRDLPGRTSSRRRHEHSGRGGVRHEGVRGRAQGGPAVGGRRRRDVSWFIFRWIAVDGASSCHTSPQSMSTADIGRPPLPRSPRMRSCRESGGRVRREVQARVRLGAPRGPVPDRRPRR
jgi:hypothetical protein